MGPTRKPQARTASAMIYIQEELSDARLRCDEVRGMVSRALELVNKSNQRDHLYQVAGDIIYGLPQSLLALQRALEAAAMAVNKVDYEDLRQILRPEKVDELERVLQEVRLRLPKRTGSEPQPVQHAETVTELASELTTALRGEVDQHDANLWEARINEAVQGFHARGVR